MVLIDTLRRFFAIDDPWERPGSEVTRQDALITAGTVVLSLLTVELMRGVGVLEGVDHPVWVQWLVTAGPCLLLLGRRRWPLTMLVVGSVAYWAIATFASPMASLLSTQLVYFAVVYSGVAYARRRSEMVLVVGAVIVGMAAWLGWSLAVGSAVDDMLAGSDPANRPRAIVAGIALTTLINVVYFGGAVLVGQSAWRNRRQRARLEDQASTISAQSEELSERAVVEERLRIARELHDVVAHHVSVIGVQAAGARRVLQRDPGAATDALGVIESSSREAVTQMRSLLRTLRTATPVVAQEEHRGPEPHLGDIARLVAERDGPVLHVEHEVVLDCEDALDAVPAAVGHSMYRTAQEALTNVAKHSTARTARVVVRVRTRSGSPFAEVEVTDDGRARAGSTGSGLGHMGIRERAGLLGGTVEVGPRATGGYRVRLRVPLEGGDA